ncbi:MAG: hypothetical protein ACI87W_000149 [Halieaceae bacterium]|jgi:hypothetical protein
MRGLGVSATLLLALVLVLGLTACGGNPMAQGPPAVRTPTIAAVGEVRLQQQAPRLDALDLAVAVFDQGLVDSSENSGRVFPTVRKAESLLLPVALATYLRDSGAWNVVRVTHKATLSMPLILQGEIIQADGAVLELHIMLQSSEGKTLLDKRYRDEAGPGDYPVGPGEDPFADIYRAISNDLLRLANASNAEQRQALARLSQLRFAAQLSPETFERFFERDAAGHYSLVSYPADGDPMLRRLQRLRRQDELFVDTVDEQYADLAGEVAESYALWREYSFELQLYGDAYRASAGQRKSTARRGSYAAMQQVYGSFRKVKVQEEDLRELVKGFTGESLETVLAVDDGVVRLSGSVDQRYEEWRGILARIYALEAGLDAPATSR